MPSRSGSHRPDFLTFRDACTRLGLDLTEDQYRLLLQYADLLTDWNSRINLISRRDTRRILTYHVIDSLASARLVPAGARCCDIGTGAGLPGIPLVIVRSDIHMILVESTQKKCRFLTSAVKELGLTNAEIICQRAEALDPLGCDIVLSRLTGPLRTTLKHLAHHVKPGGSIVLYKSPSATDEPIGPLLQKLGLTVGRSFDLVLPIAAVPRRFLVLTRN